MADAENKREAGASLMFEGLSVVVVDLLVIFFLPAAVKVGRHTTYFAIVAALALVGWRLSREATECAARTPRNK